MDSEDWEKPSAIEKFTKAYALVDALNDFPPTYGLEEATGFKQIVPDPVTKEIIQYKFDNVDRAKKEWEECLKRDGH